MKAIWELTFEDKSLPSGYRVAYVVGPATMKEHEAVKKYRVTTKNQSPYNYGKIVGEGEVIV